MKTLVGLVGVAVVLSIAPAGAGAQEAPAMWNKVCNKDEKAKRELCLTIQDVRADTGQSIVSVSVRQLTGDPRLFFVAAVPMGMIIPPGMRVQIDNNEPVDIKYQSCFGNACFGEVEASEDFMATLKSGKQLTITTVNAKAKSINFNMGLDGFTAAFEGEGMDPPAYQALLKKAQDDRLAKTRSKILDQEKAGAGN